MEKLFFTFLFLFSPLFFYGCGMQERQKEAKSSQVFRVNLLTEPCSLDPAFGFDAKSQVVIRSLFEGLTRIGSDGNICPAIAETISISEDQKTYTFTLKNCNWTNGKSVLASDFVYAWKRILASDSDSPLCDLLYLIKNAKAVKEKRLSSDTLGVEVVSPKILRIELEHPANYFLRLLSNPLFSPVCTSEDPKWNSKVGPDFICNGPFKLKKWDHNKKLIIEKNPLYHDAKAVKISEVHFNFVNDPYTALLMFEKGELDWVGDPLTRIPLEALPTLKERNQLMTCPIAGVFWLACNTEAFPLNSAKIRKALAFAICRKSLADHVLIGQKAALTLVPESLSSLSCEEKLEDMNIELARKFFQEGLLELGITEEEFPCIKLSYSSIPGYRPVVELIQEQWKKNLNIDVEIQCYEWNVYMQNFIKKQFQIAPVGWNSFFEDPMYHLHAFRHSSNATNWTGWENKEFQRLLDLADEEVNLTKRKNYLHDAEKMLLDEMPAIPLCNQAFKFVKKSKINNLQITDLGELDLKWLSISPS